MLTEKIEAQSFAVRILRGHLKADRISHTYLMTGNEQSGKEDLSLSLAAALNCLQGKAFEECECVSCHKIAGKNHPDVHILGEDEDARSIKIEHVRDSIGKASLKPYEGKWKVFILRGAERLTQDASNAFLKTLEEAPAHTVFILLTETKANLLDTIQSRAFEIRLKPLSRMDTKMPLGFAADLKMKNWEDLLDEAAGSREALAKMLEVLMLYFRERLPRAEGALQEGYLEALDLLVESQDALDGNANAKLVVSRLAMQLRKCVPRTQAA